MKKHPSPYAPLISAATGARADDLHKIETIMRDEIFHSTLDWQTEEQLADAAFQAYRLLQCNRAFYEMHFSHLTTVFEVMRAETRQREAADALDRAIASGRAERITRCQSAEKKATERLGGAHQKREIAARYLDRLVGLVPVR